MTTKEPFFDPPLTRRISAWWQGYDVQIPSAPAGDRKNMSAPVTRTDPLQAGQISPAAEMENLLFGAGATGPVNRDLVLPLLGPWLAAINDRLHLISESCDWCLELAARTDAPVDVITDTEHHAEIARFHRENLETLLPHLSIRSCEQAFAVTSGNIPPQSITTICVLTDRAPALADHLRKFVQTGMQRGDQLLLLRLTDQAAGQYDDLLDVPGLHIAEERDASPDLSTQIRGCFARWKQAADRAISYQDADTMYRHMLDLTADWESTLQNLDQGKQRFLAIRAHKTVMGTH